MVSFRSFIAATLAFAAPALAGDLPEPTGAPVLTVTGAIGQTNRNGAAVFDLDMLRALGERDVRTTTIWTAGEHVFTGVSLDTLLAALGASGARLSATAINDYSVEIPVSDAAPDGPIVAYEMDGKEMSRRDKGPLWVIYPYDAKAEYRSEVVYSRSIWQLDRIAVLD